MRQTILPRVCSIALLLLIAPASAQTMVDVWPDGRMRGKGADKPEAEVKRNDGFTRITNVSHPTLTLFPGPTDKAVPLPALIVCPGGGYNYTVMDKEGTEIAIWLNSLGYSALVLKYRSPNNREGALQDAQRALSLTRSRAAQWKIDPHKLGIIGFSAGGHLAARTSTSFDKRSYPAMDPIDELSCRPDFAVLVYPAYLADKQGGVAPEFDLKAKIPPTLIIHTEDDRAFVAGSKLYAAALTEAKVPHQFRLYPTGGHGYALRCTGDAKAWPEDAKKWFQTTLPTLGK